MKGMREAVTCAVCSELYQAGAREPVTLTCGHTFCRPCLISVNKTGNFPCPTCRQAHNNVQVDRLSVNYSLLSMSSACTDFEYETCGEHGDDLRYWCCGCELPLCSLCLYSGHPQGHNVKLATNYVKESKVTLMAKLTAFDSEIENKREEVKNKFSELVHGVSELCQNSSTLHDTHLDMGHLRDQVKKVNSIESMKFTEKTVRAFLTERQSLTDGSEDNKREKKDEDDKREKKDEDDKREKKKGREEQSKQEASGMNRVVGDMRRARLDYQDGQLLLHCLANPTDTRISLQLPSEVFLEMSVNGKCLGRVYIRLWSHLRRAQQFLALCLGTLGPSYLGSKVSKVINKSQNLEGLSFSYHLDSDKESSQAIFTNLECGSNYRKSIVEGIVMQYEDSLDMSYNPYHHRSRSESTNLSSFVICTKGDPDNTCSAPFGVVLSGLEVVKAAVSHDPVTEVTISQCGLVLPDFT